MYRNCSAKRRVLQAIAHPPGTCEGFEERLQAIEIRCGIRRPDRREDENKKPVNHIAYDQAMDAFVRGDQRPLREYRKHYAIPGAQA